MNLDLLIKLVKLANNNPNDNEANLAARKVCKMIAEADYKFNGQPPNYQPPQQPPRPQGFSTPENDIFWEFFRNRSQAGQNAAGGWGPYQKSAEDIRREQQEYQERLRREQEELRKKQAEAKERHEKERANRSKDWGFRYRAAYYDEPQAKPKIRRVCNACGVDVETSSMKDPFICGMCQWKKWREDTLYGDDK